MRTDDLIKRRDVMRVLRNAFYDGSFFFADVSAAIEELPGYGAEPGEKQNG